MALKIVAGRVSFFSPRIISLPPRYHYGCPCNNSWRRVGGMEGRLQWHSDQRSWLGESTADGGRRWTSCRSSRRRVGGMEGRLQWHNVQRYWLGESTIDGRR